MADNRSALEKLGKTDPNSLTDEELKTVLTDEEYRVGVKSGTEAKFTGEYTNVFENGKYICKKCGVELFLSDSKFESGCGWPAFGYSYEKDKNITRHDDFSIPNRPRVEVRCKCGFHLGHVFQEESAPTGERYCINSCVIKLPVNKILRGQVIFFSLTLDGSQ
uniref:Peptide-methionine (R)-S-oxide reductase n=1 Tax=Panagrolaimus sp. JU765 TaxID=591449 RepID=A0AC34RBX3_9BILA